MLVLGIPMPDREDKTEDNLPRVVRILRFLGEDTRLSILSNLQVSYISNFPGGILCQSFVSQS